MDTEKNCPECGGADLYLHGGIGARGGYGPDLLPGIGGIFAAPQMNAVVCKDCGLVRFYASRETRAKIGTGRGWHQLL